MAKPITPIPPEVLEDRYDGLTWKVDGSSSEVEWSELQHDLSWSLARYIAGTGRIHPDDAGPILDELFPMIRGHIIRRIGELGLARDFALSEGAAALMAEPAPMVDR